MSGLMLTGFPGFLGVSLLPRLLESREEATVRCLVQSKYINYARKRLAQLTSETPELGKRVELIEGDITRPDLGVENLAEVMRDVTEVFHLAAAHDVGVSRELGKRVNVDGTRNVLDAAQKASSLKRFHHVSTCHVSGKHQGLFREQELEVGQKFNNFYEETKFQAEVLVAQARSEGVPVTVYRPGFITGDSETGETQKYDGPYYLIRWMLSLPKVTPFPEFGGGVTVRLNIIPRDVVTNAITYLSAQEKSLGKTYQLADPHPMPVAMLARQMGRIMGKKLLPLPMPRQGVQLGLKHLGKLQRWMQIPPQMLDYLTLPSRYSVESMMVGLKGSGIYAPKASTFLPAMVEYVRNHGEITSRPML